MRYSLCYRESEEVQVKATWKQRSKKSGSFLSEIWSEQDELSNQKAS